MTEAIRRSVYPDGVHGTPPKVGNNGIVEGIVQEQTPPIAELTAELIFASNTGFVLTPLGQRMQAILMDYCYSNTKEPSDAKMRELRAQIVRTCGEIGVDPISLDTRKEQFDALVQARQNIMGEQWHAFSIGRR